MNLRQFADSTIKPPVVQYTLRKTEYDTDDIVDLVQEVLRTDADDTSRFAKAFTADMAGMRQLFDFVDQNFIYTEDPSFNQWVQTPSFLWYTKRGDCKSFTVFISSVLRNMGVPHIIRYARYHTVPAWSPKWNKSFKHVYPVAIINGREIPLDVVWKKQEGGQFGLEKPFKHKKDFKVQGLYKLGNTSEADVYEYIGQVSTSIAELESVLVDVPDSIISDGPGDITKMTKGELDRYLMSDRYNIYADKEPNTQKATQFRLAAKAINRGDIAGIGTTLDSGLRKQVEQILLETALDRRPAFAPFELEIPNPVPASMSGLFTGIGKFFKKVGETFANLFKKFVNWIFKGIAKGMGPYFIFLFANKNKVKSPEMRRRITQQEKTYNWIARVGKLDDRQLKDALFNGIKDKTGKAPADIFKEGKVPEISGLVSVVVGAISFVIKVVEKIVGLFKSAKEMAGDIGQDNMSDPGLLEEEARLQAQTGGSTANLNNGGGGLLVPGLLAAAGYALFAA